MKTHNLKCHPEPFAALVSGRRRFEFRRDDRGFEVGDVLVLQEWIPGAIVGAAIWPGKYTGQELRRRVTYIGRGPDWPILAGFCVMSLADPGSVVGKVVKVHEDGSCDVVLGDTLLHVDSAELSGLQVDWCTACRSAHAIGGECRVK